MMRAEAMTDSTKQPMTDAQIKDKVFDAAIALIESITGLKAPDIEVAPPEIFKDFRAHVETVHAIYQQSASNQSAIVAELVEALDALLVANKATHRTQAPDTVMQAEAQLDKIRLAVTNANALLAKLRG